MCDHAGDMQEAQQRAQRGRGRLRGPAGLLGAARHHERGYARLAESTDVECEAVGRDVAAQKRADRVDVATSGGLAQTPFDGEVVPVARQGFVERPRGNRRRRDWDRVLIAQVRQQRVQRLARQMLLVAGLLPGLQERLRLCRQIGDAEVFRMQPTAGMRHQIQLRLQGAWCVALPRKLGRKAHRERLEHAGDANTRRISHESLLSLVVREESLSVSAR